jgi:outer membrane protein OmpA-like peptidoglycan-associated protein
MRVNNLAALLAAAAILPGTAVAQQIQGVYFGAGVGLNIPQDASVDSRGALAPAVGNGEFGLHARPMGTLSLGYGFGNGVRVELEGSLRYNSVERARGFGPLSPLNQGQGQLWQYGAMANAFYDFNLGERFPIQPYIGLGAGYVHSDWRKTRVAGSGATGSGTPTRLAIDSDDGTFAYQAILGAALPVAPLPGLSVTAEYRFMGQLDQRFDARAINLTNLQATGGQVEISPYQHALVVGLRFVPGVQAPPPAPAMAPMPAPPAAAAPAPARSFLVYFDLNSAALTSRARALVGEAAAAARAGTPTRLEVAGHADRSGSAGYNQRLSQRRAEAVAAELVRQGVSRGDITIRAAGEAEPAVATRDGAREPRNRRVEITIR